jgi:peptidoglycan/LPS O-acetylase OafA/YrhL
MALTANHSEGAAYRADIDGLRAVAVVSVALFHADVAAFSGGFVGVDIFFVISGYLITGIIWRAIQNGTFTFADFYERRARRILPALTTVLLATSVAGYWLLLPEQYASTSRSVVGALLFVVNFVLWRETGDYFAGPAELHPLLHTWSLAVEEQFYLVWPVMLILGWRWVRRYMTAAVVVVAAGSFALSCVGALLKPEPTFFLLPTRIWELLVGCMLSMGMFGRPGGRSQSEIGSIAGLGLVVGSVAFLTSKTPFPGLGALPACAGAVLVIWSGLRGTPLVSKLLSVRPVVGVGLVSYSFYLWHWPMIVFYRLAFPPHQSAYELTGVVASALLVSIISWRFVEQPFRRRKGKWTRGVFASGAGAAALMLTGYSLGVTASGGWPERFPREVQDIASGRQSFAIAGMPCNSISPAEIRTGKLCVLGDLRGTKSFLLWGDSHAQAISPAVATLAEQHGVRLLHASQGGCPPLIGITRLPPFSGAELCRQFNRAMAEWLLSSDVTDVVLVARWNTYATGLPSRGADSRVKQVLRIGDDSSSFAGAADDNASSLERGLERTFAALVKAGKRVWLLEEVPYIGYEVPDTLAQLYLTNRPFDLIAPDLALHRQEAQRFRDMLLPFEKKGLVVRLDPATILCPGAKCDVSRANVPLYKDDDHLSRQGALLLEPILNKIFEHQR